MEKRIRKDNVYIYFIDNDDVFIREVLTNYEYLHNYNVQIYSRSIDFINDYDQIKHSKKNVDIVFVSNHLEIYEDGSAVNVIEVLKKIKIINPNSEVILYSDTDDIDTVSLAFHHGVYTAIKKNENFLLRLENNIKGILSQKNFLIKKQSSILITRLFIIFILWAVLVLTILYVFFPKLFLI